MSLEQFLVDYNEMDIYPMHMPGHKRNDDVMEMVNPYLIDVTEAGELDDLHEPTGVLAQSMEKCSRVFGSKSSYFLVNGSTCGILAGICASVKKGGKVMLSRACHKSVYNGIYLRGAEAVYLYPPVDKDYGVYGSISPRALKMALRRRDDIDLVVLTSPTYEGVTTDIEAMAKICHRYDIPLLVDAAHGAHFGFSPDFPQSAIRQGADIVVESIHKTLPSLTQTSLLHFNSDLVDEKKLRQFLAMFQSTSPSYVLMSGIDKCVDYLDSPKSAEDFVHYSSMLKEFSERMKELKKFRVLCKGEDSPENHPLFFGFDPGKIVISTRGTEYTGAELEEILRDRFKIQLEMSLGDYAIAMTGVCDTQEGFDRLAEAMLTLDEECDYSKECGQCGDKTICGDSPYCMVNAHVCTNIRYSEALQKEGFRPPRAPKAVLKEADAIDAEGEAVPIDEAVGKVSQEYIYAYPPGVPLVVPGEPVTQEILDFIRRLEGFQTRIHSSMKGWEDGTVFIVTEEALKKLIRKGPEAAEPEVLEEGSAPAGGLGGWLRRRKNAEEEKPLELEDLAEVEELHEQPVIAHLKESEDVVEVVEAEIVPAEELMDAEAPEEMPEKPLVEIPEPIIEPVVEERIEEPKEEEIPAEEPAAEEPEMPEEPKEEPVAEEEEENLKTEREEVPEPEEEPKTEEIVEEPAMEQIAEESKAEEPMKEPEEEETSEAEVLSEESTDRSPGVFRGLMNRFRGTGKVTVDPDLTLDDMEADLLGEAPFGDNGESLEAFAEEDIDEEKREDKDIQSPASVLGRGVIEDDGEDLQEPVPAESEPLEEPEPAEEPGYDPARDRFERLHAGVPLIEEEEPGHRPFFGTGIFERLSGNTPGESSGVEDDASETDARARFEQLHTEGIDEDHPGKKETEEFPAGNPGDSSPAEGSGEDDSEEKRTFWMKLKEFMAIGEEDEFEDFDSFDNMEEDLLLEEEPFLEEEPISASEEVHQEALSDYDTGKESEYQDVEELASEVPDLIEETDEPEEPSGEK